MDKLGEGFIRFTKSALYLGKPQVCSLGNGKSEPGWLIIVTLQQDIL